MRKLLTAACVASLLLIPALGQTQTLEQSTWGVLKSRYGQPDGVQRVGLYKKVADAIMNSPLLTNPNVKAVFHMGKDEGFVGVGISSGQVFLVLVNGNFQVTRGFDFEFDTQAGQVSARDLGSGMVFWTESVEEYSQVVTRDQFDPLSNQPGVSGFRQTVCAGIAAGVGGIVVELTGGLGVIPGAMVGRATYNWCTESFTFPLADPGRLGDGEVIGHNFAPGGPEQ